LIENHKSDMDDSVLSSPAFVNYHKELSEKQAEYELAKTEMTKVYIPKDLDNYNWNLDFGTHILTVDAPDDYELNI